MDNQAAEKLLSESESESDRKWRWKRRSSRHAKSDPKRRFLSLRKLRKSHKRSNEDGTIEDSDDSSDDAGSSRTLHAKK